MRKALIDEDGLVLNVIEIEPDAEWTPPPNTTLIDALDASTGDTWDGDKFIKPDPPEEPNYKEEWEAAASPSAKLHVLGKKMGWENER